MKKRTTVILAVFLMISLAACGRNDTSSTENKADSNEVEELQPETEGYVSDLPEEDAVTQEGTNPEDAEMGETQEDTEMKRKPWRKPSCQQPPDDVPSGRHCALYRQPDRYVLRF